MDQVRDRRGTYYAIDYTKTNSATHGEFYPRRIRYSGNDAMGLVPYHSVSFHYEDRPDLSLGFVAGSRVTQTKRIKSIDARINTLADGNGGTLVRSYRFAYQVSPVSGRSLVQSISDCDGANVCLPATQFEWTGVDSAGYTTHAAGSGNWGGPTVAFASVTYNGPKDAQVKKQVIAGDFDGDGATDLASGNMSGSWKICLARTTTFQCQTWAGPLADTHDAS